MSSRNKLITLSKNVSYTLFSNVISFVISTLVVLIIPKFIGVEDYGYWQLYIFFSSYIGFLHFGWNDGLYLRLGGADYDKLEKPTYFSQFYMLSLSQIMIAVFGVIFVYASDYDADKKYVLYMTALCMIVTNVRYMLLYILQATDKIKQYSNITILDRVMYVAIILILLFGKYDSFKFMIWADIFGKLLSLAYAIYLCKDIVFMTINKFELNFFEAYENIRVGIKLMFSNLASKLIIGNVRFGVEYVWSIAVFGKLSLTLSVSNFVLIFISAISLVMFPFLRKVKTESLNAIYLSLRTLLMALLFGILIFYFPLIKLMEVWLPKYQDSLKYLAILFPMCLYEGKMTLLISTYLKVLRREKLLLKINIITLLVSVFLTVFAVYIIESLDLAVLSILLLVAFRCIIAEIYLQNILKINLIFDIILETILATIFVFVCWYVNLYWALFIYLLVFIIYLLIKRKDLIGTIKLIKLMLKRSN